MPRQTKAAQKFNHQTINNLYEEDFKIPTVKLHHILALPRQTLIEDVEKILDDVEKRHEYLMSEK